jgi:hypothetical protein
MIYTLLTQKMFQTSPVYAKKSEISAACLREKLKELKETDILVNIPSYSNARTIGHVVRETKK